MINTETTETDPRHGVPSASGATRSSNCVPSFRVGQRYANLSTSDSESGTRVHTALETHTIDGLSPSEADTYDRIFEAHNEVLNNWGHDEEMVAFREKRLGLTNLGRVLEVVPGSKAKFVFTGMADYIAVAGEHAIVIDYKTLNGDHPPADRNDQLRGLAVLVSMRWEDVKTVRVVVIQPTKGKPTVADYDIDALKAAKVWLNTWVKASLEGEDKPATPGDWCHFCPAKLDCSAYKAQLTTLVDNTVIGLPVEVEAQKSAVKARVAQLSNSELMHLKEVYVEKMKWLIKDVEACIHARAGSDFEFQRDYYSLVEGKARESITDPALVWERVSSRGVTSDVFLAGMKVTKKHLSGCLRAATGTKGKGLDIEIAAALKGATTLGKVPMKLKAAPGYTPALTDSSDSEDEGGEA
jgi:hypothetical protein